MGGFVSLAISGIAVSLLYGTDHFVLFVLAIVVTVACFWTWGVIHNYALTSAKVKHDRIVENMKLADRSTKEIEEFDSRIIKPAVHDANAVPDKLAFANMILSILGIILLIAAIYLRFY